VGRRDAAPRADVMPPELRVDLLGHADIDRLVAAVISPRRLRHDVRGPLRITYVDDVRVRVRRRASTSAPATQRKTSYYRKQFEALTAWAADVPERSRLRAG
jgi:hypothetical protein